MDILSKHPELMKHIEMSSKTRPNEILTDLLQTNESYSGLCRNRADKSMDLKISLAGTAVDDLFEAYSDAVYAQEVFELECIYRQAFLDALYVINN